MLLPSLLARVEKFGDLIGFRIDSGEIRPFQQIAIDTGKSQVFRLVSSAVLARTDVFDLKSGKG